MVLSDTICSDGLCKQTAIIFAARHGLVIDRASSLHLSTRGNPSWLGIHRANVDKSWTAGIGIRSNDDLMKVMKEIFHGWTDAQRKGQRDFGYGVCCSSDCGAEGAGPRKLEAKKHVLG